MIFNFKGLFLTTYESQGPFMIFLQVLSDQGLVLQFMKLEGLKLPIMQTLYVFHLFLHILYLKHIKHTSKIF